MDLNMRESREVKELSLKGRGGPEQGEKYKSGAAKSGGKVML